jgi:hypothetical protein
MATGRYSTWLSLLASPDSTFRTESETFLRQLLLEPSSFLAAVYAGIAETAASPDLAGYHEIAFIILRNAISNNYADDNTPYEDFYDTLPEAEQAQLQSYLLAYASQDASAVHCSARGLRACAEVIGDLGSFLISSELSLNSAVNAYPSLLPTLATLAASPCGGVVGNAVPALLAFKSIAPALVQILNGEIDDEWPTAIHETTALALLRVVTASLQSQDSSVRGAALQVAAAVECSVKSAALVDLFAPVTRGVLGAVVMEVQGALQNHPNCAADALVVLLDVVDEARSSAIVKEYVGGVLREILDAALLTSGQEERRLEDVRALGFELLIDLCLIYPTSVRKIVHSEVVVGRCFQVLRARDDEEEKDYCLTNVVYSLGRENTLDHVYAYLGEAMKGGDIDVLCGIAVISELVEMTEGGQIDAMISAVLPRCSAEGHRVQSAAIDCVGLMAISLSPGFQMRFHSTVLPALLGATSTNAVRSVAAIGQFASMCPPSILQVYLDAIMGRFVGLLVPETPLPVLENVVTAIGQLAAAVRDEAEWPFRKYYSVISGMMKSLLVATNSDPRTNLLKGKLIECFSIVFTAVPKMDCEVDVISFMSTTTQVDLQSLSPDDPTRHYVIKAWLRISMVLMNDFVQYLPFIVPELVRCCEMSITNPRSEDEAVDEDDEDEEGSAIRTELLEEQAAAVHAVLLLAETLQHNLYPYASTLTAATLKVLDSRHSDVRSYSVTALAELVRCVARSGNAVDTRRIVEVVMRSCIERVVVEEDGEVMGCCFQCMKFALLFACFDWTTVPPDDVSFDVTADSYSFNPACADLLSHDQIRALVEVSVQVIKESLQRQTVQAAEASLDENIEYDEEGDVDEIDLQFVVADFLGSGILRLFGKAIANSEMMEDTLLPVFFHLCQGTSEKARLGVFFLDDVMEHIACKDLMLQRSADAFVERFVAVLEEAIEAGGGGGFEFAQACTHGLELAAGSFAAKVDGNKLIAFVNFVQAMTEETEAEKWAGARGNAERAIKLLGGNVYM